MGLYGKCMCSGLALGSIIGPGIGSYLGIVWYLVIVSLRAC